MVDVSAAFGVGLACSGRPCVALAFGDRNRTIRVLSNGEVQGVGAGTAITVIVVVDVGATFAVSQSRSCGPGIAFTFGDGSHVVRAVMDGQMQGVGAGTAIAVVVVVDVSSAYGVSVTSSRCPGSAYFPICSWLWA